MKKLICMTAMLFGIFGIGRAEKKDNFAYYRNFQKNNLKTSYAENETNRFDFSKINVKKELEKFSDDLNKKMKTSNDEDKLKISGMVQQINVLSSEYDSDFSTMDLISATTPAAVIAAFVSMDCDLSAELLLHATSKPDESSIYEPIYGGRVFSSSQVVEAMHSEYRHGTFKFENDGKNAVSEDLYYSLHSCEYSRDPFYSNRILITDIYDFKKDSFDGIVKDVINVIVQAHDNGELNYYNVKIDVYNYNFIPVTVHGKSNGLWNVSIENTSDENRLIVYNSKRAHKGDIRNWENLTDIKTIELPKKSTSNITIADNGDAEYMAFSWLSGSVRHVTMVVKPELGKSIGVEVFENVVQGRRDYVNLGKNGNVWTLLINNQTNVPKTIEYNSKMCNKDDAENWENLKDIVKGTIRPNSYYICKISENYFASYIAIRTIYKTEEHRLTINELNVNGYMYVSEQKLIHYDYLNISNEGKDNGWKIKITNPTSDSLIVSYNSKMCNFDDAKNWKNLKDIKTIFISSNSSSIIKISENWFATSIAVSYVADSKRLITYATDLNTNGTMTIMNHWVNL